ncbi:unnamed protein product [Cuscuta epithymum]|uniref:F-box associated domain-containing protein n=1 Tax=Cuscuta epithymum TaxID=186058 RepID=A0AAV0DGL5_9ASTE|nr:unnamed protein product [Cuscuta epithymum]
MSWIPLPPATYAKDVKKSSLLEISGRFAVINVHQNKQFIVWTLETAAKSPSLWKRRDVPFPLEEEILEAGSEFFSNTSITATSAGEIVLLFMRTGILSLWVLSDSVWKKFRIEGIAECPTCVKKHCEVLVAQNIAENLFHLE